VASCGIDASVCFCVISIDLPSSFCPSFEFSELNLSSWLLIFYRLSRRWQGPCGTKTRLAWIVVTRLMRGWPQLADARRTTSLTFRRMSIFGRLAVLCRLLLPLLRNWDFFVCVHHFNLFPLPDAFDAMTKRRRFPSCPDDAGSSRELELFWTSGPSIESGRPHPIRWRHVLQPSIVGQMRNVILAQPRA